MALVLKSNPTIKGFLCSVVNFGAANASESNRLCLILAKSFLAQSGSLEKFSPFSLCKSAASLERF